MRCIHSSGQVNPITLFTLNHKCTHSPSSPTHSRSLLRSTSYGVFHMFIHFFINSFTHASILHSLVVSGDARAAHDKTMHLIMLLLRVHV